MNDGIGSLWMETAGREKQKRFTLHEGQVVTVNAILSVLLLRTSEKRQAEVVPFGELVFGRCKQASDGRRGPSNDTIPMQTPS